MIGKVFTAALLLGAFTVAQEPARTPERLAFEVVSIRPSKPSALSALPMFTHQISPDGYHASGQAMRNTVFMALIPGGMEFWTRDKVQGFPSWIDDRYDINARVAEKDLPAWQSQGVTLDKKPFFHRMLQSMLEDRCKLAFHTVPTEIPGFALVLSKRGSKLTPSKPGAALPDGIELPGGGIYVPWNRGGPVELRYYNTTIDDLIAGLEGWGAHPLINRTNLTGRYDFVARWMDFDPDHPERAGNIDTEDPNPYSHYDFGSLGLQFEPIKIPTENFVIDHLEKPSEN